jgi:hypothetical protein
MAVGLACCTWLGVGGYMLARDLPPDLFENHTDKSVQERMRTSCEGNFHQRFECKQAILLQGERWGFAVLLDRLLLMCAPPATAWLVWSALQRKN